MNGTKSTSGLATTSLVLGILSIICCGALTGIPAVICGHIARGKIKQDPSLKGDGLAVTGLALGYLSLVLSLVAVIVLAPMAQKAQGFVKTSLALEEAVALQVALQEMESYPADMGVTTVEQLREQLLKGGRISAEELNSVDFSQLMIGNVSKNDPAGTILIRAKETGPMGVILYLPKEGELNAQMPEEVVGVEPQREPTYLE